MTQRDKLIKLLKDDNCESPLLCDHGCKYAHLDRCYEERTADYLLANSVIVLSCNIGDTVYALNKVTNQVNNYTIESINLFSDCITYQAYLTEDYTATEPLVFDEYDIDKTIFLYKDYTKKEVETILNI